MENLKSFVDSWHELVYGKADPRVRDKFMMGTPLPTIGLCAFYLFMIKYAMPKWMEDRKPFKVRPALWLCNFWHLIASAYFFYRAASLGWLIHYNFRCEPLDTSNSETALAIVEVCWSFFLFKFSYMMESVIHVLGKRYELITPYHIVHHSTLPLTVWFIANYSPGGHATFFGLINPGFHVVIFSYLVLVGAFPQVKRFTRWWKSFHMWLQIMQNVVLFGHAFQLFIWNDCNYPLGFLYVIIAQIVLIFAMLFV